MAITPVVFPVDFGTDQIFKRIEQIASRAEKRFAKIQLLANPASSNGFNAADKQLRAFNQTLDRTNDRVIALAASTAIIYGTVDAFSALVSQALKVEQALTNINVNLNASVSEMKKLSASLFDIANQTGQTFYDAAKAAEEFGRQGLGLTQTLSATRAALTLTQITGLDVVNSVESLTSAVNSFQKEGLSYEEIVNKMAAADTAFAVSSKDIAEGIKRVGSTAVDANVGFNELVATLTTLKQVTGRSGSVSGNALKTIFTRLSRSDVQEKIESIGVATKNNDGSFRSSIEVLKDISARYGTLSDAQKAYIAEATGGVYQINQVKALFQNLSDATGVYSGALEKVRNAQNEAFAKSAILVDTPLKKINALKNEVIELSSTLGKFGINDGVGNIASTFSGILDSLSTALNKDFDASSLGENVVQGIANGIIKAITGPGLAIAIKAIAGLVGKTTGTLYRDTKSQLYGQPVLKTQARAAENIARAEAVSHAAKNEISILSSILQQNAALTQQIKLRAQTITGAVLSSPISPRPARRGRTFASGYNPMDLEMAQISQGVGGASKTARPVLTRIKTSAGGHEKAVVNTDEYIVRNYMGSGADAVYNKDMIRAAGGVAQLKGMGDVRKVFAGGLKPVDDYSRRSLNYFTQEHYTGPRRFLNEIMPRYLKKDVLFQRKQQSGKGLPLAALVKTNMEIH